MHVFLGFFATWHLIQPQKQQWDSGCLNGAAEQGQICVVSQRVVKKNAKKIVQDFKEKQKEMPMLRV